MLCLEKKILHNDVVEGNIIFRIFETIELIMLINNVINEERGN